MIDRNQVRVKMPVEENLANGFTRRCVQLDDTVRCDSNDPVLAQRLINAALSSHIEWLRPFGSLRVSQFEKTTRSNPQGAACEALISRYLRKSVDNVEPFEDLSRGGPDLRCEKSGKTFYVEVTSLANDAVAKASWIPDDPNWQGGSVGSISAIIRTAVSGKVRQCTQPDGPSLVAIGMLHSWVSMQVDRCLVEDVLISDVSYVVGVSPEGAKDRPSEFITNLRNAIFMEAITSGVNSKRQSISGVLMFGLGISPPNVIGVLNDRAHRRFDPNLLSEIPFGQARISNGRVDVAWFNDSGDSQDEACES